MLVPHLFPVDVVDHQEQALGRCIRRRGQEEAIHTIPSPRPDGGAPASTAAEGTIRKKCTTTDAGFFHHHEGTGLMLLPPRVCTGDTPGPQLWPKGTEVRSSRRGGDGLLSEQSSGHPHRDSEGPQHERLVARQGDGGSNKKQGDSRPPRLQETTGPFRWTGQDDNATPRAGPYLLPLPSSADSCPGNAPSDRSGRTPPRPPATPAALAWTAAATAAAGLILQPGPPWLRRRNASAKRRAYSGRFEHESSRLCRSKTFGAVRRGGGGKVAQCPRDLEAGCVGCRRWFAMCPFGVILAPSWGRWHQHE